MSGKRPLVEEENGLDVNVLPPHERVYRAKLEALDGVTDVLARVVADRSEHNERGLSVEYQRVMRLEEKVARCESWPDVHRILCSYKRRRWNDVRRTGSSVLIFLWQFCSCVDGKSSTQCKLKDRLKMLSAACYAGRMSVVHFLMHFLADVKAESFSEPAERALAGPKALELWELLYPKMDHAALEYDEEYKGCLVQACAKGLTSVAAQLLPRVNFGRFYGDVFKAALRGDHPEILALVFEKPEFPSFEDSSRSDSFRESNVSRGEMAFKKRPIASPGFPLGVNALDFISFPLSHNDFFRILYPMLVENNIEAAEKLLKLQSVHPLGVHPFGTPWTSTTLPTQWITLSWMSLHGARFGVKQVDDLLWRNDFSCFHLVLSSTNWPSSDIQLKRWYSRTVTYSKKHSLRALIFTNPLPTFDIGNFVNYSESQGSATLHSSNVTWVHPYLLEMMEIRLRGKEAADDETIFQALAFGKAVRDLAIRSVHPYVMLGALRMRYDDLEPEWLTVAFDIIRDMKDAPADYQPPLRQWIETLRFFLQKHRQHPNPAVQQSILHHAFEAACDVPLDQDVKWYEFPLRRK